MEITIHPAARDAIDEAHAKRVRKVTQTLRETDETGDGKWNTVSRPGRTGPAVDAGLEKLRACIDRQVERRRRDHDRALALLDEPESGVWEYEL